MQLNLGGCGECICKRCLLNASGRCPYGSCMDDYRAIDNPYNKTYPNEPPRTSWSDWSKPGEQGHWCRGGLFYAEDTCDHFIPYIQEATICRSCLEANVVIYQDGYIKCSLIDLLGCEECYRRFEARNNLREGE